MTDPTGALLQDYPGGPVYRVGTSHGVVMQEMKSRGIGSFWVLDDAAMREGGKL